MQIEFFSEYLNCCVGVQYFV